MPDSGKLQGPGKPVQLDEKPALWKESLPSSRRLSGGPRLPLRKRLSPARRSTSPADATTGKENLCPCESSAAGQENLAAETQQKTSDCQRGRLHLIR